MNYRKQSISRRASVLAAGAVIALQGCSSGSGSSEVGEQEALGPVAIATIVGHPVTGSNGDVAATVRGGAEVTLAANNSFGRDAPILEFDWKPVNAAAQAVELVTRSSTAKSFTAPTVAAPTTLEFELTVEDAHFEEDTATVKVDVEPIGDPNRFLTYLTVPGQFRVTASTSQPIATDTPFIIDVSLRVTYPDRQELTRVFETAVSSATAGWFAASPPRPGTPDASSNPVLTFQIPQLDLDVVNAAYLGLPAQDAGRNRILDPFKVDRATSEVLVTLRFPPGSTGNASQAVLFLTDESGGAVAGATCMAAGAEYECVVPLQNLATPSASAENATTASVYYNTIDPGLSKTTLRAWLEANCFDADAADFGADSHAVYTNNFDLGFGRDMYLKRGSNCSSGELADGEIASVVVNYPSLLLAGKKLDPIIAVAMEYAPPASDPSAAPFASFYVFAPDDASGEMVRVSSANFDGRGEKFVPGVCAVCHGGRPAANVDPNLPYPNNGDVGAIFMPWDLDSFLFSGPDGNPQKDPSLPPSDHPFISSVDAEVLGKFTRANQEAELRELNEAVLTTYPQDAHVRRLVHDWYSSGTSTPDYASNTLAGNFRSDYVPPEWQDTLPGNSVQPAELYSEVIAQHCRACHTQLVRAPVGTPRVPGQTQDIPTFESFQAFVADMTVNGQPTDTIIAPVFDLGVMPLARLTSDRFWAPGPSGERPSDLLAAHLGVNATRIPGRPSTTILSNRAQYVRGDDVRLDGETDSRFVHTFDWDLAYTYRTPANCTSPGTPLQSQARLIGDTSPRPGFNIDVPGDYVVALTVQSTTGQTFTADPLTISVANNCPVAADNLSRAMALGTTAPNSVNLNTVGLATNGDAPHTFEIVADSNVAASLANGQLSLECTAGCALGAGFVDFRVTDRDGDSDVGRVNVTVTGAPAPNADDVTLSMIARTPTFSSGNQIVTLNVYNATSGGIGNRTITALGPRSAGGTASIDPDGRTIRYVPLEGFVGQDTFTYTVTDSNPAEAQSATATVFVNVNAEINFDNEIYTDILSARGCATTCHGGAFPTSARTFFALEGDAAASWAGTVTETRVDADTRDPAPTNKQANLFYWPPNVGHTGSFNGNNPTGWGGPASTCGPAGPDTPYCRLLRWVEEGACRVDVSGQPIMCPAP